jgi:hypothetical protein
LSHSDLDVYDTHLDEILAETDLSQMNASEQQIGFEKNLTPVETCRQ